MSTDARNSIYLWVGSIAFFGLFWAALEHDLIPRLPDAWLWPMVAVVTVINGAWTIWGFWQRRASNPDNPRHM